MHLTKEKSRDSLEINFRNKEAAQMIKRCNDFGAGGVCVAIGEIAESLDINLDLVPKKYDGLDGTELAISESQERMAVAIAAENKDAIGEIAESLDINLDLVPKKYDGLDGTELAISESQERMAVAIAAENKDRFIELAKEENLTATHVATVTDTGYVATVTDTGYMRLFWNGKAIVDLKRAFLDTNGAKQKTNVVVEKVDEENTFFDNVEIVKGANTIEEKFHKALSDLNTCSQKGLVEKFDTSIGGNTVVMPFGGKYQATPETIEEKFHKALSDLNTCSQKGLVEKFDTSIGGNTVVMPFGGKYQATPEQGMVAKIPVLGGETDTSTIMTYGYNPKIGKWSPYHGALYAVVESVAKLVALGGNYATTRLTFQEYFERLGKAPERWGKPFAALLGAYYAQEQFEIPAIGGKDSMSGTFKDIDVPPTLVSFAVDTVDAKNVVTSEFKKAGSKVVKISAATLDNGVVDFDELKKNLTKVRELILDGKVLSSYALGFAGVGEAVAKMGFGNHIGFKFSEEAVEAYENTDDLFAADYGTILLELAEDDLSVLKGYRCIVLGETTAEPAIDFNGEKVDLCGLYKSHCNTLESIYPTKAAEITSKIENVSYVRTGAPAKSSLSIVKPKVLIPAFPGTNCEYDAARAFDRAGAESTIKVFRNLSYQDIEESIEVLIPAFPGTNCEYDAARAFDRAGAESTIKVFRNLSYQDIEESIDAMVEEIKKSQIIMIPGGFSAGDEPDGSAKFIATVFRNPKMKEAVHEFLNERDGLMLGICNGFQALIKLGLVPYGEIIEPCAEAPTLTYNNIGRHQAKIVNTRIASNKSPWLAQTEVGDLQ